MFSSFAELLQRQFMPHGACYLWDPPLLFVQVGTDALIALSYFVIAGTLLYFVRERHGLPYPWMFLLFSAFIFACGTTHAMEIWTVWRPAYWIQGFLKIGTAGISLATAVLLVPLIPKLLELTPTEVLVATNEALERETDDRVAVERELEQERRYLHAVLDSVNAGIVACDVNDEIVFINQAVRKLHALAPDAGPPRRLARGKHLYTPDGALLDSHELPLTRALRGDVFENLEIVIRPENAPPKFVLMNGQPIYDEKDRKLGAVVAVHDVTEPKQLENELLSAKKLESLGRLAGGVAHDFNNVLTAIRGYTELAMYVKNPEQARNHLNEVQKATERAAALTSQLLAVSRKQIIQPQIISLNSVVEELARMLHRLIREDVELDLRLASQVDHIRADPGQVSQVLINLVVNASDAMPLGGKLTVETENRWLSTTDPSRYPDLPCGDYVVLSVSDTGVGLGEEAKERLIDPFYTTKAPGRGTGLGLSTSQDIISSAGGSVFFTSTLGQGTRFELFLPRVDAPAAAGDATAPPPRLPEHGGFERVLLVEDEAQLCRMIAGSLAGLGYRVESASSGNEATAILRAGAGGPFDLLVTDVILPQRSGTEIAGEARSHFPDIKVLFISGYTDDALSHHGVRKSGAELLPKPFSLGELAEKVRDLLDSRSEPTLKRDGTS